jgi:L-ribulose-5-phosphate 4-epimerase
MLDKLAETAFYTLALGGNADGIPGHLLDKHYLRKHGKNSYYGQKERGKDDAGPREA